MMGPTPDKPRLSRAAVEQARAREGSWLRSPAGEASVEILPLVSVAGQRNLDYPIAGPLRPSAALRARAELAEALAGLGLRLGRARLVRVPPGAALELGADDELHWTRFAIVGARIEGELELELGDRRLRPELGELWTIEAHELPGRVVNASPEHELVLLVVERRAPPITAIQPGTLELEPYRFEVPEPPTFAELCDRIRVGGDERLAELLDELEARWRAAFERFGHDSAGELGYRDILLELRERVGPKLAPGSRARQAASLLTSALKVSPTPMTPTRRSLPRPRRSSASELDSLETLPLFERPIFILSAPRSGSTLLFELLARLPECWTIGGESHAIFRGIPALGLAAHDHASDGLSEADASADTIAALRRGFAAQLVDRSGTALTATPEGERPSTLRLLEKTPANALRVPFLRAVFPDALFLHLVRDPRPTISSLVEGWRSRKFVAHRNLPGWPHREWSFLLAPGWPDYADRPLVEIAAFQWRAANQAILAALADVPAHAQLRVRCESLIDDPAGVLARVADFAGLRRDDQQVDHRAAQALALTRVTLSPPDPDKWRRHEHELERLLSQLELDEGLGDLYGGLRGPIRGDQYDTQARP